MRRFSLSYAIDAGKYVCAGATLLLIWDLSSAEFNSPVLFPGPRETAKRFIELVQDGELQSDIGMSLWRIFAGYSFGTALGVIAGLAIGSSRLVADLLRPYVDFFRFIAPSAWIGTVMMWFGLGEFSKISLIIYATMFVVLLSTLAGVLAVHPNKKRAAQCFGATPFQIFIHVTFPSAAGHILVGMRMALMNAFMTLVAAEMVVADSGIGYLIYNSRLWLDTSAIFVGMITLGVLGITADRLFVYVSSNYLAVYRTGAVHR